MGSGLVFHTVRKVTPNAPAIEVVADAVREAMASIHPVLQNLPRGAQVAVTAGSRGIDRMDEVIREICRKFREAGAEPFIVPAMGSHGGATAEGQRHLLEHLGISEKQMGAPVRSSMETVSVGRTSGGVEVYMDRLAWECGRVFAVNRVKPHTDFDGVVESGILKIIAVGLGKLEGATQFHLNAIRCGYENSILEMSRCSIASGKILGGLGVVENDRHRLCEVGAAGATELEQLDRRLQARAQDLYPKLPFASLDLLIVDELGKNISGAGMDAKVIGRPVHAEMSLMKQDRIKVRRIYVRDLTAESEGNAAGIGFADLMHRRIAGKIDFAVLYKNAATGLAPNVARMPMHVPNDKEGIQLLSANMGSARIGDLRIAWIRNTLSIISFCANPTCIDEVRQNPAYEIGPASDVEYDDEGNLKGLAPAVA